MRFRVDGTLPVARPQEALLTLRLYFKGVLMTSYRRGTYRFSAFGEDKLPPVDLDSPPENPYQYQNWVRWKASGKPKGMARVLADGSVFWSRGNHQDCDRCHSTVKGPRDLIPFQIERDGYIISGFSCTGRE